MDIYWESLDTVTSSVSKSEKDSALQSRKETGKKDTTEQAES